MENKVRKYAAMQVAEMQCKANPGDALLAEAFKIAKAEYEKVAEGGEPSPVEADPKKMVESKKK